MLWNSLRTRLDPLVTSINNGIVPLFIGYIFGLLIFLVGIPLVVDVGLREYRVVGYVSRGIAILILFIFLFGYGYFLRKGQKIDDTIRRILHDEFESRINDVGYTLEYRTAYTGYCKPKGVHPARVLVFMETDLPTQQIRVVDSKDKFEDDGVDRESWGLTYP